MMTGLMFRHQQQQQQQQQVVEENRSNLTVSVSGETTVSINTTNFPHHHQQYLAPPSSSTSSQSQPVKKKRNLPGNPDPDAEVIALSPTSLLATNRFICEVCNKGFQRDQNLQLHRRGHNLPWKLKQRGTSKEAMRKKVYVCPEATCVHHAPARALGDLTGIKKHFCRKHGEKKWKCDKCSKKYAVQSDWKAHSKTCGTREYRCDCGTLFCRRDSFITHRAFCDALAEESARAGNPLIMLPSQLHHPQPQQPHFLNNNINDLQTQTLNLNPLLTSSFKKEHHISPPWLEPPSTTVDHHRRDGDGHVTMSLPLTENPNPNPSYHLSPPSPHMSATALLQKAAQMGATISKTGSILLRTHQHQQHHHPPHVTASPAFNLSPRADHVTMSMATTTASSTFSHVHGCFLPPDDDGRFEGAHSFDTAFIGGNIFNSMKDENYMHGGSTAKNGGGGGGNEGLTKDFLGLRPLAHGDILGIAGIGSCIGSSHDQQNYQSQKPWQG